MVLPLIDWLMLLPWQIGIGHIGWNCLRQMSMPLWQMLSPLGHYCSLSSMLLIRTSSHMCGRWYFPMFLFRDGLLTLMNIDSLISLERFCSSLPTMLKLFKVILWSCDVAVFIDRGVDFQVFLVSLSKCSSCLTYVLLITFKPIALVSINYATLFC